MARFASVLAMIGLFVLANPVMTKAVSFTFTPAGWKPEEWILVKSPRMEHVGKWVQKEYRIQNDVPAGIAPEDLQGKRANDTYTSMVYAKPFTGDLYVAVGLAFTYRMAPLIVVAPELGKDAVGRPEYREHFEICVFNEGVNVWHHTFVNGKPSYKKDAYATSRLCQTRATRWRLSSRTSG